MGAITLTRKDYMEGLDKVTEAADDTSYLDKFVVTFPDGMNTANTLEICRAIQNSDLDSKIRLMRICMRGRNVHVVCPNGEEEKFCMSSIEDNLEGFPLFQKEPLSLLAIADCVYGYILKKYIRPSKPQKVGKQ